jgi:hypothetical protein
VISRAVDRQIDKAIRKHFIVTTEDNLVAVGGIRSFAKL